MPTWVAPYADGPLATQVVVPGSKSATARALVLAALATGPGTVAGGLVARDCDLMKGALRALGTGIDDSDPDRWVVTPADELRPGARIDCGLAGTVARFVPPLAATIDGTTRFHGDEAASARPMAPLLDGLVQCGAEVLGSSLPFQVTGPVTGGEVDIDASGSSQLVSGLLLAGARFPRGLRLRHVGRDPVPSAPYVALTVAALRRRGVGVTPPGPDEWWVPPSPVAATDEVVPPDLMNAAAFLAAAVVTGGRVTVAGWPETRGLPGTEVPDVLAAFGATSELGPDGLTVSHPGGGRDGVDLDLRDSAELTPVVAALMALAHSPSRLRGVAHVRGHETDRLAALAAGLRGLGAEVTEHHDGLDVVPRRLTGGVWRCHADHRLAHAGALLGLAVRGVALDDVASTSKTMPTFPAVWTGMLA